MNTLTTAALATLTANFCPVFVPVNVTRGKKFHGFAYDFGAPERISGNWAYTSYSTKLWDPQAKEFVYATTQYCEKAELNEARDRQALVDFVNAVCKSTYDWCASKSAGKPEAEIESFAKNVIRKYYPWFPLSLIFEDHRSATKLVMDTIDWALSLRTKPCRIYGKFCAGGKPYPEKRVVTIAYKALVKKEAVKLPAFASAWKLAIATKNLPVLSEQDMEQIAYDVAHPKYNDNY